jgi:hypothetical protein
MREYLDRVVGLRSLLGDGNTGTVSETQEVLRFYHTLSKSALAALRFEDINEFISGFPDGLTFSLQQGSLESPTGDYEITLNMSADDYQEIVDYLDDDISCTVSFTIDKRRLALATFGQLTGRWLFYFYERPFLEVLSGDILRIEREWIRDVEKLFVVIGQPFCLLNGWILHVFGGMSASEIRGHIEEPLTEDDQNLLKARLTTRMVEAPWQDGARILTPDYLSCIDEGDPKDTAIKPRLNKHLLDLILFSLANYTLRDPTGWTARFEGRKQLDIRVSSAGTVSDEVCNAWLDLYKWVYESRSRDKMAIVRNLLTLHPYDEQSGNYVLVTTHAKTMLTSSKHHFDQLVGESVEKYFDKLKEATSYLQGKVDAIGQQIAALVDTLVKTLLGTVGFAITTVLSKLLDPKSGPISQLVVGAFILYILATILAYYPVTLKAYQLNCRDYQRNETSARRIFSEADLKDFMGSSYRDRCSLFQWTFWGTLVVYVLLMWFGPRFLGSLPSGSVVNPSRTQSAGQKQTGVGGVWHPPLVVPPAQRGGVP